MLKIFEIFKIFEISALMSSRIFKFQSNTQVHANCLFFKNNKHLVIVYTLSHCKIVKQSQTRKESFFP